MNNITKYKMYVGFAQENLVFSSTQKSTIYDLKRSISKRYQVPISNLNLKVSKIKRIEFPDNTLLDNSDIRPNETILVELISTLALRLANQSQNFDQVTDPNGLIMLKRTIPADNSCLFASIAYALENKNPNTSKSLREIVARHIASEPDKYNEIVLEMSNKKYQDWILNESNWGGAIEAEILSNHYKKKICIIDTQNLTCTTFGADQGYAEIIYILYSGAHYDAVVRNTSEDMDEATDITIFSCQDKYAFDGAMTLAKEENYKDKNCINSDFYEEELQYLAQNQNLSQRCYHQANSSKLKRFFHKIHN